jgi:hypothetical protein
VSQEEKITWFNLSVVAIACLVYSLWLLGQLGKPRADILYATPMLAAIGGAAIAAIIGNIALGITAPKNMPKLDQRDLEIRQHSEFNSQFVVNIAGLVVLVMCMYKFDYFVIAHTLYYSFVANALLGAIIKLFAYRQGFYPQ